MPATFLCTTGSITVPPAAPRKGTRIAIGGNICSTAAPHREARPPSLPLFFGAAVSRCIDVSRTAFTRLKLFGRWRVNLLERQP
jgi:hypothetical protein